MELPWKTATSLLNRQLMTAINLHDVLHGFRAGRGVGDAGLEDNLLQQLMAMKEVVLFKVLLDLQKSYEALDWCRCLEILVTYGVVPRTIQHL